jgi:hypothetical protein
MFLGLNFVILEYPDFISYKTLNLNFDLLLLMVEL